MQVPLFKARNQAIRSFLQPQMACGATSAMLPPCAAPSFEVW